MDAARSAGKKAVRKKTAPRKAKPAQPVRKKMASKSKSNKLVCRYCGSDDLAPSFIKRRDRRCRKCFSKRYGSAARARKAKGQEVVWPRLEMRDRARKGSLLFRKATGERSISVVPRLFAEILSVSNFGGGLQRFWRPSMP